jgi:hypothetical protein
LPTTVVITNTGDFLRASALFKRTASKGTGGLRAEATGSVEDVMDPLPRQASTSAREILPRRGGLARAVSKSRFAVRTDRMGQQATVSFQATNDYNIISIDLGRVRHPVFGDRTNWVTQVVRQGWFTRVTDNREPPARRGLIDVMETIRRRFDRI